MGEDIGLGGPSKSNFNPKALLLVIAIMSFSSIYIAFFNINPLYINQPPTVTNKSITVNEPTITTKSS